MTRRSYAGGANTVTLTGPVGPAVTSLPTTAQTNWPDHTIGNFAVVINRGNPTEEKVLCSDNPAGSALTVVSRGYDGTTAQSHAAGESVEHCITSIDIDEVNEHVNLTQAVHGLTGTDRVVGEVKTATLRNKSISGANNTLSNIPDAAVPGLATTQAALTAETTARTTADTTLQSNIDAEAATRAAADTSHTIQINANTLNISNKVDKAGDTLTGPLILAVGAPSVAREAAPKSYVDGLVDSAWTAYTPTIAGTGFTKGNGTCTGRYIRIGNTVWFVVQWNPGGTTIFGTGQMNIGLPSSKTSAWNPAVPNDGQVIYYNGAQYTTGVLSIAGSASTFSTLIQATGTSVAMGRWTGAFPSAQASGDHWAFWGFYEAL